MTHDLIIFVLGIIAGAGLMLAYFLWLLRYRHGVS